jgi:NAD(P)-dependent dehydrogenase (short-subunit alcohol dehydrogenase family)
MLKARGRGSIVTVASTAAFTANGNNAPYGAAKAGITGLTRQLCLEALPEVRINCVAPGRTITGMTTPLMLDRGGDLEEGERMFGQKVPMQRMGTAAELASAICFFLSDDASFITGQTLLVDGGETIT